MTRILKANSKRTVVELSYQDNDKECKLELVVDSLAGLKEFIKDHNLDKVEKGHELVSNIYKIAEAEKPDCLETVTFSVNGAYENGPKGEPASLALGRGYVSSKFYYTNGVLNDPSNDTASVQYFRRDGSVERTLSHHDGKWSGDAYPGPNGKAFDEDGNVTSVFNESAMLGQVRAVNMFTPIYDALTEPKRRKDTKEIQKQLKPITKIASFPS